MQSQFAELYEKSFQSVVPGDVVTGTIIEVRQKEVVVDIGYKAEGVLPFDEFTDPQSLAVGQEVEVLFEGFDDREGTALLSKRKADRQKTWNDILSNAEEGAIVEGRISRKVRGGFMVDIGMEAFLPASLVDIRPVRNQDAFVGLQSKFLVVKINHKRKNVVVSRKDLLEKSRQEARSEKLNELQVGQIVHGKVKNITDFGVFIDIGNLDGLLHITDMSWGRISHPSDLVKIGDEIDVAVISIDKEKQKISLGLKQKSSDPWETVEDRYAIGNLVHGRVVNILPYGAFVELEPGIEGLVHISELSWTKRVTHPSEVLSIGQQLDVVILSLDTTAKKISLGARQAQENPWDKVADKYQVGSRVQGTIRNLTDYGAFVELEPGIEGLLHVSDLSWTHKVAKPSDLLQKGETMEVMVLNVDTEAKKISLGLKQMQDDPWNELTKDILTGLEIQGKITRVVNFGVFVELDNGLEGLIHVSELPEKSGDDLVKLYKVGETIRCSVLHVDHDGRKIALTCKNESISA
ncbi:MAG: 30S ribosomal protein S1 [Candidatus Omnitrophica bacterium ADurb.Bin292]|jgi:small subunit ribosomal protein S1|nr:MAG: 30S ribosomal protein S1 [Candidatus Omnitrophica bacterium ADurb.Bin292]HOG23604.1 30S ribosomal protein S1 [Candidatus Omnitrophota bacterium]